MRRDDAAGHETGRADAPPAIVALVGDRAACARLNGAAREYGGVTFFRDGLSLRRALRAGDALVVIVDTVDPTGTPTWPLVEAIRADFPGVPVVAYCDPKRCPSSDILALARAGVSELVISGIDDVRPALGRVLESADRQCMADEVLRLVGGRLPPAARDAVAFFLRHAHDPRGVTAAAGALGMDRKTLRNRLSAVRLPSPSELAGWCRLLIAARRLDAPGRAADQVALELGFPSGSGFRNMLRRYTGLTPTELRTQGGSRLLAQLFLRRLCADGAAPHAEERRVRRPHQSVAATARRPPRDEADRPEPAG